MKTKAIYPGTFDPLTNGHVDIVERAAQIFEHVYFAVADSTSKKTLFTTQERMSLADEALKQTLNVSVISFDKLTVDCARENEALVILRGLRTVTDFEYELQLASMNRKLYPDAETMFLTPDEKFSCISSSLVREIAQLDGDVSELVPANVLAALNKKLSK